MKNVIATGYENDRPSTESFSAWLTKINEERHEEFFGIEKYIMSVERNDDVTSITTFNGSVYTISFSEKSCKDLKDLVGYKVTFYPKAYEKYELEAYFLWKWDEPLKEHSFGHLVVNKVVDVERVGRDGLILFENGDAIPVPFKDYEKPYFRASKRLHGDDTYREGYAIDFDENMQKIRDKFVGEYAVYSTKLNSINVGNDLGNFKIYRESAHKEYAEKDKFSFRVEHGVIKKYATWDTYRISIYLEDGRIMTFSYFDYSRHINGDCKNNIIYQLKKDLATEIGKLYKFLVICGGDKDEDHNQMDIVSLKVVGDGELLSESNPPHSLDSDWWPRSPRSQTS